MASSFSRLAAAGAISALAFTGQAWAQAKQPIRIGVLTERSGVVGEMGVHNDINWCMANSQSMYHCTVAVLTGVAD